MAVKTTKKKTTTNIANNRTKPKTTSTSKSTAGKFASSTARHASSIAQTRSVGGRPATATGQMNKGKGAAGASKPPKPVMRPAGGTKGGGRRAADAENDGHLRRMQQADRGAVHRAVCADCPVHRHAEYRGADGPRPEPRLL